MNAEFCVFKAPGPFVLSKYQIWIPNKGWHKRKTDNFLIYAQTSTWKSNNRSVFGKYINVIIPWGRLGVVRLFFRNFTVDIIMSVCGKFWRLHLCRVWFYKWVPTMSGLLARVVQMQDWSNTHPLLGLANKKNPTSVLWSNFCFADIYGQINQRRSILMFRGM